MWWEPLRVRTCVAMPTLSTQTGSCEWLCWCVSLVGGGGGGWNKYIYICGVYVHVHVHVEERSNECVCV